MLEKTVKIKTELSVFPYHKQNPGKGVSVNVLISAGGLGVLCSVALCWTDPDLLQELLVLQHALKQTES